MHKSILLTLLSISALEASYHHVLEQVREQIQEQDTSQLPASEEINLLLAQYESGAVPVSKKKRKRKSRSRDSSFSCPCGVTGQGKDFSAHLEQHGARENTKKSLAVYKCPAADCSTKELMYIRALKSHIQAEHMHKKTFVCSHCPDKVFFRSDLLNRHIKDRHSGKPQISERFVTLDLATQCPCGTTCLDNKAFLKHITEHQDSATKKYVCPIIDCKHTVGQKSTLIDHIRAKHTGQKAYVCQSCSQAFDYRGSASNHAITCQPKTSTEILTEFEQDILRQEVLLNKPDRPENGNTLFEEYFEVVDIPILCPCSVYCDTNNYFKKHVLRAHRDSNSEYMCPDKQCNYRAARLQLACDHIRTAHASQNIYKCKSCNSLLGCIGSVSGHIKLHIINQAVNQEQEPNLDDLIAPDFEKLYDPSGDLWGTEN